MKTNKRRGISLIVLVITIIVMIILAAAIILSLSNSGIISKATKAKGKYNRKTDNETIMMIANKYKLNDADNVNNDEFKNELVKEIGSSTKVVGKNDGVEVTTSNGIFFVDSDWMVTDITENKWDNITVEIGALSGLAKLSDDELEALMLADTLYSNKEITLRVNVKQEDGIKWKYGGTTGGTNFLYLSPFDISDEYFELLFRRDKDTYCHKKVHEMQYTIESTGETYKKLYNIYDFYGRGYVDMSSETSTEMINPESAKASYKMDYRLVDGKFDSNKYELYFITIVCISDTDGNQIVIGRQKEHVSNFKGTRTVEYTYNVGMGGVHVYTTAILCDKNTHEGIQILGELVTWNSVNVDIIGSSIKIGLNEEFLY